MGKWRRATTERLLSTCGSPSALQRFIDAKTIEELADNATRVGRPGELVNLALVPRLVSTTAAASEASARVEVDYNASPVGEAL